MIEIRDAGIGIPAADLPHIFDPFVQAANGRDQVRGGIGLGLTLVRRLLELHGGTISAASGGAGEGSQFTIRLPALPTTAPPQAKSPLRSAAPAILPTPPAGKILIVDDNVDAVKTLAMLLLCAGMRFTRCRIARRRSSGPNTMRRRS